MEKVGKGQAYGVLRTESRVKVRMERKVMDTKQGSWKQTWSRGSRDQSSGTVLHGV